ncbi:serine/threonine/tyrosine-interacting-like protein 1 isoform X3 [Sorex fumeus]|uniref:serine/threonine/tyrosine-interacting-like protein 1 isoform X3 n=1 Tax=Sorex fumeus TaxID=62283 RepID=UPI0024ACD656|nr:serine/threonine/tyrosine-interacting-like protein 1 isoform X3 [Sorex fumeus]
MAGLVLCEPKELYNILNQVTKLSRLTEPNYLCLLDVRPKQDYDESHVITAHRVKKKAGQYVLPESVDLECVRYCVVYDSNTFTLDATLKVQDENSEDLESEDDEREDSDRLPCGAAIECGRVVSQHTRQPVLILKGGYELFSAMYHFFRTQKIIWMPQELDAFKPYPFEILEGQIYLGNFAQACDPQIQKDLKIKAHVNISTESTPFFVGDSDKLLHIQVRDSVDCNLFPFLRLLCHFIEVHLELDSVVLIFSTRGINRSCAATIAFLMHYHSQSLKRSWASVKSCQNSMILSRSLVVQLSQWEKVVLGNIITDIQEPFC